MPKSARSHLCLSHQVYVILKKVKTTKGSFGLWATYYSHWILFFTDKAPTLLRIPTWGGFLWARDDLTTSKWFQCFKVWLISFTYNFGTQLTLYKICTIVNSFNNHKYFSTVHHYNSLWNCCQHIKPAWIDLWHPLIKCLPNMILNTGQIPQPIFIVFSWVWWGIHGKCNA